MKRLTLAAALIAAASPLGLSGTAVQAQSYTVPTVTVFGTDACPRDTICVRAPENERYRIPKDLRGDTGLAMAERCCSRPTTRASPVRRARRIARRVRNPPSR